MRLFRPSANVYAAFSGEPGTQDENSANMCFNSICHLVELGLVMDISDDVRFSEMHAEMERQGQQVIFVTLSRRGREMFGSVPWGKWLN